MIPKMLFVARMYIEICCLEIENELYIEIGDRVWEGSASVLSRG